MLQPLEMIGSHLVISAIATSAALAGCFTYLVQPKIAHLEVDQLPHLSKLTSGGPSGPATPAPKLADKHPVENEQAAIAYLEAAQAILRRAPTVQATASADEIPITGRVPLPRRRPIPRP